MARGVAKLFGIDLMENFRLPYMAASTGDFWSRWHISLSSWFRDYLYIPLGGNRSGRIKEIRNIMLTMILSGLWHGAAWNFLLWGSIHGVLHVASKLISSVKLISYIPLSIKRILIFIVIIFTWIFFKAETATDAFDFIYGIFSFNFKSTDIPPFMIALMIIAYIHHWLKEYRIIEFMERDIIKTILSCLMIFYIIFFCSGNLSDFIYFQF
jgi:D-alanyl-lipoteichoic acid acyltransferase DltB (MBOAT superfamily)